MPQDDVTNVRPTSDIMVIIVIMSFLTSYMLLPHIDPLWLRDSIPGFFTLLPGIILMGYGCYVFGVVEHGFQNVKSVSELMDRREKLESKKQSLVLKLQENGKNFTEAYEAWANADEVHKDKILEHRNHMSEKWWTAIQEVAGVKKELEAVQGEIQTRRELKNGEIEELETWTSI